MNWLRRRDPAVLAIVVTLLGALVIFGSLNIDKLPMFDHSTTYHAQFENAAGLREGDDVRVGGISVGSVTGIAVEGGHVRVTFTVRDDLALGSTSGASVELATVLGSLFVQVESAGPGRLRAGGTIPVDRTSVPFTLLDAVSKLGEVAGETDLPSLRKSLTTLSSTLRGIDPRDVRATLKGLTGISEAIASRQDTISRLLTDTSTVIRTLSAKRNSLVRLMGNADTFARMLHERRDVINSLLQNTADLGRQISVLIVRNGAKLGSVLDDVQKVGGVLAADSKQLSQAITLLGSFSTKFANATGAGPWIDVMLPTFLEPDNIIAACGTNPVPGCGH